MNRLIALAVLTVGAAASATDVIKQDNTSYQLTVVDGGYTSKVNVGKRNSNYGLCASGPCTFSIKGSSITATKDDKLLINGGKLRKM